MIEENLEQRTRELVRDKFSEYYRTNKSAILPPPHIERREFGFLLTEGVMVRHKSFKQVDGLVSFIEATVPSDVYHSAAYYLDPEAPMDSKCWTGSDLIFDIDADHIDTECKERHDRWSCLECKATGHGKTPKICPNCGRQKLSEDTWMCYDCLERAKEEVLKLIDLLNSDFGVNHDHMRVNFSGHRGYHLHVDTEDVKSLGSEERKAIADYVTGTGLDGDLLGFYDLDGRIKIEGGPKITDPSWRGRVAGRIDKILFEADVEELRSIGLKSKMIETVRKRRKEAESSKDRSLLGLIEGFGEQTWKLIIQRSVSLESVGIDTVVTTDIHRLIRLPGTLNGKTGLRAMKVQIGELLKFNPLEQATVFGGYETVHIQEAPQFTVGGEQYGPFKDVDEKLPTAAAIFLLCKRKAYPVVKPIV